MKYRVEFRDNRHDLFVDADYVEAYSDLYRFYNTVIVDRPNEWEDGLRPIPVNQYRTFIPITDVALVTVV